MKLETALNKANELSARIKKVNGIIATPLYDHKAVKIKKVWLFGSAAKGKSYPNDVDILVDAVLIGKESGPWNCKKGGFIREKYGNYRGYPKRSDHYAVRWLKNRRHNVSIHMTWYDKVEPDVKIMIYPRNDLIS